MLNQKQKEILELFFRYFLMVGGVLFYLGIGAAFLFGL
jgi:hypothetical protein